LPPPDHLLIFTPLIYATFSLPLIACHYRFSCFDELSFLRRFHAATRYAAAIFRCRYFFAASPPLRAPLLI